LIKLGKQKKDLTISTNLFFWEKIKKDDSSGIGFIFVTIFISDNRFGKTPVMASTSISSFSFSSLFKLLASISISAFSSSVLIGDSTASSISLVGLN
jgi:hypothetical protein